MSDTSLFPATGYQVSVINEFRAVVMRTDFIASSMQSIDQATPGPNYVLQPAQARELAHSLLRAAEHAESLPEQSPSGGPQH